MNVLFLTIGSIGDIEDKTLYSSLLKEFRDNGHNVYAVSPYQKRDRKKTEYREEKGLHDLRVKTGNITKCSLVEKGISTLLIETQYKRAIKKFFKNVKFDLILYSTPPITLVNVIKYIKKRDLAKSYLLLKDIFPQNAIDLGIMKNSGLKGLLYKFFRAKEKKLYAISDRIGCMSQANVDYVLKNNPEIPSEKVEICPNCVEFQDMRVSKEVRDNMRTKYDLPLDKKIFVYGGNLGRPQGIPFIIKCIEAAKENNKAFFLIVGDGTEYSKLESYIRDKKPENVRLMKRLPKEDYDCMVAACDVGLIFLDHRFTIPNFPSRLLSYMQAGLPVLACTDPNTDIGRVIEDGGFGWWCESNDAAAFAAIVQNVNELDFPIMANKEIEYFMNNYTTKQGYEIITKSL